MSSTPKYSWVILLFAVLIAMINQIDKILIGLVSVPLMKELGLSASQWGLVGSSFYVFFTITSILLGGMADSRNPKKLFIWMSIIWLSVQFFTPFVSSFALLILTRMILGAGEGPASPVVTTMLGKWFPKHRHGISYAAVLFGTMMGPAIATPFLISMIDQYGWESAFITMGIVGCIWLGFWLFYGKASPQEIGLPSFDQVEKHSSTLSKVSWHQFIPHLFSRNYILTVLAGGSAYWLVSVQSVWYPAYFSTVQQFTGQTLKLAVALPFLFAAFSQIGFAMISDWLYRKTGDIRKARVNLAGLMMVLSAICLYLGSVVSSSAISILCFTLAPGFGIVTLSLAPSILMDLFSPQNIGKAQGAYIALSNLGSMMAPLVFGYFIQYAATETLGYQYAFQASAVGMIITGVLFLIGVRPTKQVHATIKKEEEAS